MKSAAPSLAECYRILGVPQGASLDEIKHAYRTKAFALHPDLNPSAGASRQFQQLNEAYVILIRLLDSRAGGRKASGASPSPDERTSRKGREAYREQQERERKEKERREWQEAERQAREREARQEKERRTSGPAGAGAAGKNPPAGSPRGGGAGTGGKAAPGRRTEAPRNLPPQLLPDACGPGRAWKRGGCLRPCESHGLQYAL